MPAPQYGNEHQKARAIAISMLRDGVDICRYCRRPMYKRQRLDYDHVVPIVYGGKANGRRVLTHSRCNRQAGGRIGGRRKGRGNRNRRGNKASPNRANRGSNGGSYGGRKLPEW
jgi:5-methylcytosine-specific restriction endonuclease McrA